MAQTGDTVHLHAGAEIERVLRDRGPDGHADQPRVHAVLRERCLEDTAAFLGDPAVGLRAASAFEQRERRELPVADAGVRVVAELDDQLTVGFGRRRQRELDRLLPRDHMQGLRFGYRLVYLFVQLFMQLFVHRLGHVVVVGPRDVGCTERSSRVPRDMARAATGGGCNRSDRHPEREQHSEQRDATEDHARTDDAGSRGERGGDAAPQHATGIPERVERTVERWPPVGQVQDADIGDEEEQRAERDPERRPLGRTVVRSLGIVIGVEDALDSGPPLWPHQQHGERDAHDRNRHPRPPEDRAGAVGEGVTHRTCEVGPQTQGAQRADHHEAHRSRVGPVAGELAGGGGAARRPHRGLGRGHPRSGGGPATRRFLGGLAGPRARGTLPPCPCGRHPEKLTPSTPATAASRTGQRSHRRNRAAGVTLAQADCDCATEAEIRPRSPPG